MPNIETQIARKISKFEKILRDFENCQQVVFDVIPKVTEDDFTKEETQVIKKVLNAFVSLSFAIKQNPNKIEKYLNYHD